MELFVKRGDTVAWTFEIDDGDPPTPRDLTGDFLRFTVKNQLTDADSAAVLRFSSTTSGITILDQTDYPGQFTVTILPADTAGFTPGRICFWDVQATLSDGSVVTPFQGRIVFDADVTINTGAISGDT